MSKQNKKWIIRIASFALAGACLCGGAALAAGGDKQDPLVTLSYLTKTAIPEIMEQVEDHADKKQEELLGQFNGVVERYKEEMRQESENTVDSSAFVVVTLSSGQKLELGVGCEVMLRVGAASVTSDSSPALVDTTTGASIGNGAALETNHLYMSTIEGRYLTASSEVVKVLARGSYTVVENT